MWESCRGSLSKKHIAHYHICHVLHGIVLYVYSHGRFYLEVLIAAFHLNLVPMEVPFDTSSCSLKLSRPLEARIMLWHTVNVNEKESVAYERCRRPLFTQ